MSGDSRFASGLTQNPVFGTAYIAGPILAEPWVGALTVIPADIGFAIDSTTDALGNGYAIYAMAPNYFGPLRGYVSKRSSAGTTQYFSLSFQPKFVKASPGGDVFIMDDGVSVYRGIYRLNSDGSTPLLTTYPGPFSGNPRSGLASLGTIDDNENLSVPVVISAGLGQTAATFILAATGPVPYLRAPLNPDEGIAITPRPILVLYSANPTITLTSGAVSSLPMSYQWSFNGVPITGATQSSYTGLVTDSGRYDVKVATTAGYVSSATDVLFSLGGTGTPTAVPVFAAYSNGATINNGSSITLTATAGAISAVTFQWYLNGSPLPGGATSVPSPSIYGEYDSSFVATLPGTYTAVATTTGVGGGSASSGPMIVTILDANGHPTFPQPSFVQQPQDVSFVFGRTARLTAAGTSTLPLSYQWQRNDVAIPGATSATYDTSVLGTYTVVITSSVGSTTSASAVVTLANRPVNISSRASVGTNDNASIAGFVVSSYSGATKRILIRAVGPGLTQLGVSGVLARPGLSLFNSRSQLIATNTGWNDSATLSAAAVTIGAFALPAGSADSALLVELEPGAYTAQVAGLNASTGVALIEVYELVPDSGHFVNISTRARVGTDANILIGGFVTGGTAPSQVLIRAVGPGLSALGVSGGLPQCVLAVYNSRNELIGVNTGWSNGGSSDAVALAAAAAKTGAFALQPGSSDAALLLSLVPGPYTVQVSGANATTGIALVEVYQVPQ